MKAEYFDREGLSEVELVTKIASLAYNKTQASNPDRLYRHLVENGHHSVFEFIDKPCILYVEAPIYVARQIMRHRSFSFLERSLRFTKNTNPSFDSIYSPLETLSFDWYMKLLSDGEKPEKARKILPMNIYTRFYMGGDEGAWANFFFYRLDKHAQEETRNLALMMANEMARNDKPFFAMMIYELNRIYNKKIEFVKQKLGDDANTKALQQQFADVIKILTEIR